ncbi:MAG: pyridoxine 5'-phosphate synthase [Pseudomonadota bacterium]
MTQLSVNLNKIALLRNSRGRDFPNVVDFAQRFIDRGVHGITIHPRPDERHIHRADAYDLGQFLANKDDVEFNIEGNPTDDFLRIIEETRPEQCTLVPDDENQLTSDHGWDLVARGEGLRDTLAQIKSWGVRVAVFLDPDVEQVERSAELGVDRIELYTEGYANAHWSGDHAEVLTQYRAAAQAAQSLGVGVNAGHDLDLENLGDFLAIGNILEVSIGHALTVECILHGIDDVVTRYLKICESA